MTLAAKLGASILLFTISGCSPTRSPPHPQGQVVTEVGFVALEPEPPGAAPGADDGAEPPVVIPSAKDQPPHVKLKLGHYVNSKRGIGVTIDLISARTDNIADIDPAKLRFDGDPTIYLLHGEQTGHDRIDFVREPRGNVMLHVWDDGRRAVYVPDPDDGRSSEMMEVVRDADADPLYLSDHNERTP